jgi:hypothetical protein
MEPASGPAPRSRQLAHVTADLPVPVTLRQLRFLASLLALVAGAWLRVDAAPLHIDPDCLHNTSSRAAALTSLLDATDARASAAVAAVAVDIDADGDVDVVGLDRSLELLLWENDGSGRLTLKEPTERTYWFSNAEDAGLASPCTIDTSDQSDDTSPIGLDRSAEPVVARPSRALLADSSAPLCSRTRTSRSPRAPPVTLRSL